MKNIKTIQKIGALSAILAGTSHITFQTFAHLSLLPHATFFFLFGSLQILWGYRFYKNLCTSLLDHFIGIIINGGFVGLWIITRVLPAPFIGEPESITTIGIIVAILEIIALAGIFDSISKKKIIQNKIKSIAFCFCIMLGAVSFFYGVGMLGENLFPSLKNSGHHGHHGEETHMPSPPVAKKCQDGSTCPININSN